jgi:hypothetical protein
MAHILKLKVNKKKLIFAFCYLKSLEPVAFDIKLSFKILFMCILGGLGTINGAFIGAAFILLFPTLFKRTGKSKINAFIGAAFILLFPVLLNSVGKSKINAAPMKAPLMVPRPPKIHINSILKDNLISKATGSKDFR